MENKSIEEVVSFIHGTNGKFFGVKFIKRTTGEQRDMVCRTGVHSHLSGGVAAYNPTEKGLICVFDVQKNGYRSIPIEGIIEVKIDGVYHKVTH